MQYRISTHCKIILFVSFHLMNNRAPINRNMSRDQQTPRMRTHLSHERLCALCDFTIAEQSVPSDLGAKKNMKIRIMEIMSIFLQFKTE